MQKTGGTHIRRVLKNVIGGIDADHFEDKHKRLSQNTHKYVFGTIRNPWSWYVSLWAFGCERQGGWVYDNLTLRQLMPRRIARELVFFRNPAYLPDRLRGDYDYGRYLYADAMKIDRFREWLEYIHDGRGKYTLPDSYGRSRVAGFTGYMTYQFVLQFAQNMAWRRCRSAQALKEYMDRHFLTDKIIKLENAKTQLLTVLEEVGYDLSPAQRETYDSLFSKKTNTSEHLPYRDYYDPKTIEMVREKDKIIIERFGYEF